MQKAADWDKSLNLTAHPEGGSYRETYSCPKKLEGRPLATSIYFLLKKGEHSNLHRLDADEIWYHLDGQTLTIHTLSKDGGHKKIRLGTNGKNGEEPSLLIPAGTIFGAEPASGSEFCLCSCVVTPGFKFTKLEIFTRKKLLQDFPEHVELINRMTPRDQ